VVDPTSRDVVAADLGQRLDRTGAVGVEADGRHDIAAEPANHSLDHDCRGLGFLPSIAPNDLGDGAANPGRFLGNEDGLESAVK